MEEYYVIKLSNDVWICEKCRPMKYFLTHGCSDKQCLNHFNIDSNLKFDTYTLIADKKKRKKCSKNVLDVNNYYNIIKLNRDDTLDYYIGKYDMDKFKHVVQKVNIYNENDIYNANTIQIVSQDKLCHCCDWKLYDMDILNYNDYLIVEDDTHFIEYNNNNNNNKNNNLF